MGLIRRIFIFEEKRMKTFKAQLQNAGGGGVFLLVPYDVEKEYGKKNMIPVKVTFDGEPYRGSIANMGNGPCLPVLKALREKIGKQVGDFVKVTVEADKEPRKVEVPADLKKLLAQAPEEKKYFQSLAFSHQKEYVRWITDAKRPETRSSRLGKTLEMLRQKRKNPTA